MQNDRNRIIKKVYYESFGSIKRTLKEAREIDPTIKEKDIKAWKDTNIQRKINLKGTNSFVASKPREEYQMDLFEMPITVQRDMRKQTKAQLAQATEQAKRKRRKGEGFATTEAAAKRSQRPEMATGTLDRGQKRLDEARAVVPKMMKTAEGKYKPQPGLKKFGLLVVDIFTKFVAIEPLEKRAGDVLLTGLRKVMRTMGGTPETLYSDEEGGLETPETQAWLQRQKIRLLTTRTHAHFAERHIRTIKDMIFKRMDHKKIHIDNWHTLLPEVLTQYNTKMVHSAIGMTPDDATIPSNEAIVKGRLQVKKLNTRRYPEIRVGDKVKYYQKKDKLDKERVSTWSTTTSRVTAISESHGQKYYTLNPKPVNSKRPLQRAEILKVT